MAQARANDFGNPTRSRRRSLIYQTINAHSGENPFDSRNVTELVRQVGELKVPVPPSHHNQGQSSSIAKSTIAPIPRTACGNGSDGSSGMTVTKQFKPLKDKKDLNRLALAVNEFLQEHDYPKRMTLLEFNQMTGVDYYNICKFALQLMMGKKFLDGVKQKDAIIEKLMTMSVKLKYPGFITSSILKAPNCSHSWPKSLGFMAWLCGRCGASITHISPASKSGNQKYSDARALEKVLDLWLKATHKQVFNFDDELQDYENDLRQNIYGDQPTVEELQSEIDERLAMIKTMKQEPDPCQEITASLDAKKETLRTLVSKETEMERILNKCYEDRKILEMQAASTGRALDMAQHELEDIQKKLTLDAAAEKQLLNEIKGLKKQQECVVEVIQDLKMTYSEHEEFLSNLDTRFYEGCKGLKILDSFNACLFKLERMQLLENPQKIPNNPFSPTEVGQWLNTTKKILRETKELMLTLQQSFEERKALAMTDLGQNERKYSEKCEVMEGEIKADNEAFELKLQAKMSKLAEVKSQGETLVGNISEEIVNLKTKFEKEVQEIREELKKLRLEHHQSSSEVETK